MAAFGIKAIQPQDNEHILGFATARATADLSLLEVWNGPTSADLVFTLDKDGQLQAAAGTVLRPAYSYEDDKDSGHYRIGANNIGLALNGAKVMDYATTGVSVTGTVTASGILKTDSTTDATNGTDGSLQTDGGLSVVKAAWIGTTLAVAGNSTFVGTLAVMGLVDLSNHIVKDINTTNLIISGGSTTTAGGNVVLYGSADATNAGDILFRSSATIVADWDESADEWTFAGTSFVVSGTSLFTGLVDLGDNIVKSINTTTLIISGGSTTSAGANIILFGGAESGGPGDILFRSAVTTVADWDESADEWTFTSTLFKLTGALEIDGALNHDGSTVGFYGVAPTVQLTGVAVSAAGIHAALVTLGLITA